MHTNENWLLDKTEVEAINDPNTFERLAEKTGINLKSATVKIWPCFKAGWCFYFIFMSQSIYWRGTLCCPSVPYPSENMHLHLEVQNNSTLKCRKQLSKVHIIHVLSLSVVVRLVTNNIGEITFINKVNCVQAFNLRALWYMCGYKWTYILCIYQCCNQNMLPIEIEYLASNAYKIYYNTI